MHEYEFRKVVESSTSLVSWLHTLGYPVEEQTVYYLKPHFRFRRGVFETKRVKSTHAVYHDGCWFRWIHSVETPYRQWSRATYLTFLHQLGNFQDPLTREHRHVLRIDDHAQLYTFQKGVDAFRLVFEWEHGTFAQPLKRLDPAHLLGSLHNYRSLYRRLSWYAVPAFTLNEQMTRKPVACLETIPQGDQYVYAHKLDGVFGLVYSYRDKIKEKWEGHACRVRQQATLGPGLVFAAERLDSGDVYLLDVYQVRGHDTAKWCRKAILTQCLPGLAGLVEGYRVQTYVTDRQQLRPNPPFPTDGLIVHNVVQDTLFKWKTHHSIDVTYYQGYFQLPTGRIPCLEEEDTLEEGCVYEISTQDGRVLRKRTDRFKGNTALQLEKVLRHGWHGPAIEPLPAPSKKKKRHG